MDNAGSDYYSAAMCVVIDPSISLSGGFIQIAICALEFKEVEPLGGHTAN
jgi:hypothetical protein